jgi:acetyltransferase-like isoleucine patch superfamily enzyme
MGWPAMHALSYVTKIAMSSDPMAGTPGAARIPRVQDQLSDRRTSAREKYTALVVGRPGLAALVKHEAVTLLSQSVPGALGLALRRALYPTLLGACGRGVVFGQNVVLRHPRKIRIGDDVVIDDNCLIDAKGSANAGILIGDGVFVGRNSILSCKEGDIEIGAGANIGFNCEIFSASRVTVGPSTMLAAYCYVIGGDHDMSDASAPVLAQGRRSRGVTIGAGAWLGAGAKILDGVSIGDGAVVGASAVVRESVPPGAVAVGVPARIVGRRGEAAPPAVGP